ncbi:uncharacterized protein LOC120291531 isoform X2 [Eucalyptus grandis]|uniref:uncharacterized protein LOC120291531 isoform X2 n=1 Tax=Eucalyptus grandis TaxID=71139 RepID=UPI00192EFEE9|nr:uncharacterized protein LOC120291531 isoform X2 [Eucalyptus grandis]
MEMEGRAGASLPFVGMIMVVLVQASSMVVAKMAMSDGLNKYTLAFYCQGRALLSLSPCFAKSSCSLWSVIWLMQIRIADMRVCRD